MLYLETGHQRSPPRNLLLRWDKITKQKSFTEPLSTIQSESEQIQTSNDVYEQVCLLAPTLVTQQDSIRRAL